MWSSEKAGKVLIDNQTKKSGLLGSRQCFDCNDDSLKDGCASQIGE